MDPCEIFFLLNVSTVVAINNTSVFNDIKWEKDFSFLFLLKLLRTLNAAARVNENTFSDIYTNLTLD